MVKLYCIPISFKPVKLHNSCLLVRFTKSKCKLSFKPSKPYKSRLINAYLKCLCTCWWNMYYINQKNYKECILYGSILILNREVARNRNRRRKTKPTWWASGTTLMSGKHFIEDNFDVKLTLYRRQISC